MAGWTRKKRVTVEKAFYEFLNRCYVNSKDSGRVCLGEVLYDGQRQAISGIFDALEADIHNIYILKSRQLGISTIIRALVTFLLGVHPGLKGAIVFDTDVNKVESRAELEVMIKDLPDSLRFPAIQSSHRQGLTLRNDSKVLFMSAGTTQRKSSGTLGRSVGLSLAHCSELCSWDNPEGLEAFQNSLSDMNPDRLYIYESTARGFNDWHTMWRDARSDPMHCKCIFLGWWSKPTQIIERSHPDFMVYGEQMPTELEQFKIKEVKRLYYHDVTPEQLAWVRRKMDPTAQREGDAPAEFIGSATRIQEQPWTESEAFQQTGSVFFAAEKLTDLTNNYVSKKFKTYMFLAGVEFIDMRIYPASNAKSVELKVWEEPDPEGYYVIAVDPAFGKKAKNCNSVIEVFRCYADGIDQVAEYAWPLITTYQLAWALASLMGWYGAGPRAEVRYILELNGPGDAVFNELRSLKFKLENTPIPTIKEEGLRDLFRNVKTYIFNRQDSLSPGHNYHFTTQTRLKLSLLERFRDFASTGLTRIRSLELIEEMKTIAREGDSIGAPGTKLDDRVMATALAVHCWEEKMRRSLISSRRTRETEASRKNQSVVDQITLFNQNNLEAFFKTKHKRRLTDLQLMQQRSWRYGSGRRY